jgi:hypothetical protein
MMTASSGSTIYVAAELPFGNLHVSSVVRNQIRALGNCRDPLDIPFVVGALFNLRTSSD